ncbi:S-methyl-5-thioribose-1-phosphate isomerase [Rubneribacter sp.]|nr:S-methyl-5-thioribose-1-phosphate isomerase [Candidatus Rubneribacter avistercoris]
MGAAPHMENLPRTVELVRAANGAAELVYVDQRRLPRELVFARTSDWREVVGAVKSLAVRGAPAIGAAGAAAVALWAQERARAGGKAGESYLAALSEACALVAGARPTAVNLAWGVGRMERAACDCAAAGEGPDAIAGALFSAVKELEAADEAANRAIGAHGAALLPRGARVLTHCNAGSLATVFYGTALGVVYAAAAKGGIERVYADETRPVGQGARLTCWELARAGVSVTLLCDNMAASLMARGEVDAVVVGADRIAANGDTANKVGTYGVAVLAAHHGIPFYVAAPESTIDRSLPDGSRIPIEERDPAEVAEPLPGVEVWNPAFDVTPAALVTRIITERGTFAPSELVY